MLFDHKTIVLNRLRWVPIEKWWIDSTLSHLVPTPLPCLPHSRYTAGFVRRSTDAQAALLSARHLFVCRGPEPCRDHSSFDQAGQASTGVAVLAFLRCDIHG